MSIGDRRTLGDRRTSGGQATGERLSPRQRARLREMLPEIPKDPTQSVRYGDPQRTWRVDSTGQAEQGDRSPSKGGEQPRKPDSVSRWQVNGRGEIEPAAQGNTPTAREVKGDVKISRGGDKIGKPELPQEVAAYAEILQKELHLWGYKFADNMHYYGNGRDRLDNARQFLDAVQERATQTFMQQQGTGELPKSVVDYQKIFAGKVIEPVVNYYEGLAKQSIRVKQDLFFSGEVDGAMLDLAMFGEGRATRWFLHSLSS